MAANPVKLYGLIPVSPMLFLVVQGGCLGILLAIFFWVVFVPPENGAFHQTLLEAAAGISRSDETGDVVLTQPTTFEWCMLRGFAGALENAPWILLGLIGIGLLESFSVRRKFLAAKIAATREETTVERAKTTSPPPLPTAAAIVLATENALPPTEDGPREAQEVAAAGENPAARPGALDASAPGP